MNVGKANLNTNKNIYLIGFMAAGKSTVGKILANKLQRQFLDTDELIEHKTGQSIPEIFQTKGETYFRQVESEIVQSVAKNRDSVIAVGGGAVLSQNNWRLITQTGCTIYLEWNLSLLLPRILHDHSRPVVSNKISVLNSAEITNLFNSRKTRYQQADYSIMCDNNMTPSEIALKILSLFERK
ncbi:MAG: shikimate kinase [bacterium]